MPTFRKFVRVLPAMPIAEAARRLDQGAAELARRGFRPILNIEDLTIKGMRRVQGKVVNAIIELIPTSDGARVQSVKVEVHSDAKRLTVFCQQARNQLIEGVQAMIRPPAGESNADA